MSGAIVGIVAMAVLFMAFAWVRPGSGCSGHCGTCEKGCELEGAFTPEE